MTSLEEVGLWRVPQLKEYLRDRGWKVTGTKAELTARVFTAIEQNVQKMPSAQEERDKKCHQYKELLKVGSDSFTLPDPFSLIGWKKEDEALDKWPPIMALDIAEYLLQVDDVVLRKRLLSDYKEGKAYSYVDSNFVDGILHHPISGDSNFCFLKSKSLPSQCHKQTPHEMWVAAEKKSGKVVSAYCTCHAG